MSKRSSFADLGDFDVITSRAPNRDADDAAAVTAQNQPPPQPPPSKHEIAYQALRVMIAQGELRHPRHFLLQPLSERLDVSRNTLTRAMNRLVGEELLCHTPQKGYALLSPVVQQIEAWYGGGYEQVRSALAADQNGKRPRHYGIDREEKLALAEVLPELAPPLIVATEFEDLLRAAVARAADPARKAPFESNLAKLTAARRIEHLVVPDHREEVALLMRSFYRGQYDRFLRALDVYTTKRIRVAAQIVATIQLWALRADVF